LGFCPLHRQEHFREYVCSNSINYLYDCMTLTDKRPDKIMQHILFRGALLKFSPISLCKIISSGKPLCMSYKTIKINSGSNSSKTMRSKVQSFLGPISITTLFENEVLLTWTKRYRLVSIYVTLMDLSMCVVVLRSFFWDLI